MGAAVTPTAATPGSTRTRRGSPTGAMHAAWDDHEDEEQTAPVAGIIDLLDSYAFIRTSGHLPGPNDVYVSMGMVKKYGPRKATPCRAPSAWAGTTIAQPAPVRAGAHHHLHQRPVQEEAANRPQFEKPTPVYPSERLTTETQQNKLIGRMIDIVSPIGKGQRGLIVSPPKAGKTITLQAIANAIHENNPSATSWWCSSTSARRR